MGHEIAGVIMKYKKNKLVDTKKKILLELIFLIKKIRILHWDMS